jgi:hypothetical protein
MTARRWPRLCLALVLVAFSSQSVAVALDWCFDAVGGTHVANVFAPCGEREDPEAQSVAGHAHDARSGDDDSRNDPPSAAALLPSGVAHAGAAATRPHCHDGLHAGAPGQSLHHVAASSDATSSLAGNILAVPVSACWQFVLHVAMLEVRATGTAISHCVATPQAAPRPTLSGAIPGDSSRLLI